MLKKTQTIPILNSALKTRLFHTILQNMWAPTRRKKHCTWLIKTQLRLTNIFNYHPSVVNTCKLGNNTTKHTKANLKATTNEVKPFYSTNFETKTIFYIESKLQYFVLRLSLFLNLHSCNIIHFVNIYLMFWNLQTYILFEKQKYARIFRLLLGNIFCENMFL